MKRKKCRPLSRYSKDVIGLVDRYVTETGNKDYNLEEVAAWLRQKGLMDAPPVDINKMLARTIARILRQEYTSDENGEPVRTRHSYRENRGDRQMVFWFKMEDATPEKMRLSAQNRRTGTLMDVLQLARDLGYYNKHFNPGDPIEMDYNFNPDVEELRQPTDYPDAPPEE